MAFLAAIPAALGLTGATGAGMTAGTAATGAAAAQALDIPAAAYMGSAGLPAAAAPAASGGMSALMGQMGPSLLSHLMQPGPRPQAPQLPPRQAAHTPSFIQSAQPTPLPATNYMNRLRQMGAVGLY